MDEAAARAVVLVRAIETADGAREISSDADRAWAGRTAAEVVGEKGSADAFLGQRATLALRRLGERYPKVRTLARAPAARGRLVTLGAFAAFAVGAAGVEIGPAHRINLLAPPVLALLAWNLLVYATLAAAALRWGGRGAAPGPLRRRIANWLGAVSHSLRTSAAPGPLAAALARFATDWSTLAAPLWQLRAARLLHVGAAALAAGAIAGLYVRGIALEYRAAWQSTFLDAGDVARLLRVVLAPGSWLTGIAIPGADHLQTLSSAGPGENAARWIHLYAATVLLIVIAPRSALAAAAWMRERRIASRFPIALEHAYFRRLLHGWREGTARVVVLPYSFEVPRANADGFARVLARAFACPVDIGWLPSTPYGADDLQQLPSSPLAAVVALFNASATPERENHGAFVAALAAQAAGRAPLVALVDTSDFVDRFRDAQRRIAERRAAWEQALAAHGCRPLFVRLAAPDLADAAAALTAQLELLQ
ncbi:MAG TPA: DUF2868 domain-containing protein [Casimicrobiaceae bacterium]